MKIWRAWLLLAAGNLFLAQADASCDTSGAACDAAQYVAITSGSCEDLGYSRVLSYAECEKAKKNSKFTAYPNAKFYGSTKIAAQNPDGCGINLRGNTDNSFDEKQIMLAASKDKIVWTNPKKVEGDPQSDWPEICVIYASNACAGHFCSNKLDDASENAGE